jgi:glycosyltransferase involved in cell wall biosynthesis
MDSIKAACDGTQIRLHLDASHEEKVYLYQNARAVIFPSAMGEPFGLIVPEAGSCGSAVIGSRDGAIPETIEEGVTGFICDTVEQMIEAVKKTDAISPQACRKRAEQKFSRQAMAENYIKLYRRMLKGDEW